MDKHPNRHATYNRPPTIRNKLPRGNFEVGEEFHYKWMNEEMKITQEGSFVDAHFTVGKRTIFSLGRGKRMTVPFGNWNLFMKPLNFFPFKEQDSKRAWRGINKKDGESFDIAVSTSLPIDSSFDDRLVLSSLDLISMSLSPTVAISKWYWIKEWQIKG